MTNIKISEDDIKSNCISSLKSNPMAPKERGGNGLTPKEMREAFDKLPLLIIERFNLLIDAICAIGENSAAAMIPTGIKDEHTLSELFGDIRSGDLAAYLTVSGKSLAMQICELRERLEKLEEATVKEENE